MPTGELDGAPCYLGTCTFASKAVVVPRRDIGRRMIEAGPCRPQDRGLLKPRDLELPDFDFESPLLPAKFPKPAMSNRHLVQYSRNQGYK
jgi:hypothetical protein